MEGDGHKSQGETNFECTQFPGFALTPSAVTNDRSLSENIDNYGQPL